MKRKNMTRNALVTSIISMLLCVSMLVGTTFAWFTDEVTSGMNTITAGNLDVELYHSDKLVTDDKVTSATAMFDDIELWEPGVVAWENLTVVNEGTLALKYQLAVNFGNENYVMEDGVATCGLSDILKVAIVEGGVNATLTRDQLIASIPEGDWAAMDNFAIEGNLLANTGAEPVGIVIWWQPSDADNNWNLNNGKESSDGKDHLHIDLGVSLVATQFTYEEDSFDETYDLYAAYPQIPQKWLTEGQTINEGALTVIVPKGAPAGEYALDVTKFDKTVAKNDHAVIDMDFTLTRDGEPVEPGSALYTVIVAGDVMSDNHKITHNGEPVNKFQYDVFYNGIMFTTTSFSPFTVEYDIFGEAVDIVDPEAHIIKSGLFKELDSANPDAYNPIKLDPTLASTDAASVVIKYNVDGVVHYAVSDRASSMIISAGADNSADIALEFLNGAIEVKTNNSGKLWNLISSLKENNHNTLYLLPGTYNEATTIYIYSSMDIIGLGKAADVKVVKGSSSGSNRHLFNATGTKTDYIEVSLRNLHLDATAKTTNGKDNAAVQSIRKSKVKCYDLEIVKGTGWDAVAFYVNGNNAVDGVKYPAYLYVEHCDLNTTRTFGVVTTSGSYKFYHNGLTYGGTTYTSNGGSIKNVPMAWYDWNW